MTPKQAQALRDLIVASRRHLEKSAELLDKAEAALAEHLPNDDFRKKGEAHGDANGQ